MICRIRKVFIEIHRFFYFIFMGASCKPEWRLEYLEEKLEREDYDYINNHFIPHNYWKSIDRR